MGTDDRLDTSLARFVKYSGRRGFSFSDLVQVAFDTGTTSLTPVVDWLARARSAGVVADLGFDPMPGGGLGPRRYAWARGVARAAREDVA